jgi:TonB family protein
VPAAAAEVVPPSLEQQVVAVYPAEALAQRFEGTVGLELTIDETGKVVDARVISAAGHGFDESALAAARAFAFSPARQGGKPIRSKVQFAYEFHLPPAAVAPPLASSPVVLPQKKPPRSGTEIVQTGADQSTLVLAPKAIITPQEATAASQADVSQSELALRPRYRAENMIEAVPGLFSVQHAGGGKAHQYFLRGFDEDHGTDLAFSVDGAPVNAVSHAHGQGYSDLHFLIPETVETLESSKGPYSLHAGDFETSGAVNFHMADHFDESSARAEYGSGGHTRLVGIESPNLGDAWRAAFAAELYHDNGPFIHPQDFNRFNAYAKATHTLDEKSEVSFMLMAYGGTWNMSGVLPARAVCGEGDGTATPSAYAGSHCLSRWDSVDPSQGGASQRVMAQTSYKTRIGKNEVEAMVFTLHSILQLFPNDGIASSVLQPMGIQYGSQVEQDDTRTESGASVRVTRIDKLVGMDVRTTFGLQFRDDIINAQLHRDEQRHRLDGYPGIPGPITDSDINETQLGAYAEEDVRVARWLRFVGGARVDRVDAAVNNESDVAVLQPSGYVGQAQLSPKMAVIVSPDKLLDLYANYGRGFHSNDARTVLEGAATTLLATATGYEVGTTVRPLPGLSLGAVAFLLDITSELTWDGDTATVNAAGPTRRYGGEFTGRYHFADTVYADAALTVSHARYTDQADIQAGTPWVTLAPRRTFSAGIGTRQPAGPVTLIGTIHVKSMADRPATQNWDPHDPANGPGVGLTATGWTLVDLSAGVRWRNIEVLADVLNVADVKWREGQFAVDSRLPGEGPAPATGMSFTPGNPRTLFVHANVYW